MSQVVLHEGVAAATPATGKVTLYAKTDGLLYSKDDAGTETPLRGDVAAATHAATSKTAPVDADEIPLSDSAASWGIKKLTWSNLKTTLATWLETLTATWSNKTLTTPVINGATGSTAAWNIGSGQIVKDTSGNVGIGEPSPGSVAGGRKLAVQSGIAMKNTKGTLRWWYWDGKSSADAMVIGCRISSDTVDSDAVTIDAGGNVGIGSAPDADTLAGTGLNVGAGKVSFQGLGNDLQLTSGATWNGTVWKYTATGVAPANYYQSDGTHVWRSVAAGTDGNSITWLERMRIDSSGNVIQNVNTSAPALATNQQMVFALTSNTNLRISVRGTDGTTRVANITLA